MKQVLIGGCERSGTTMLGSMLGAHSDAICTPESQFIIQVLRSVSYDSDFNVDLRSTLDKLRSHRRFIMEWNLDISAFCSKSMPEKVCYSELIERLVESYSQQQDHLNPKIWIDHSPGNIFYSWMLLRLFPEAKLINLVRDGRAVTASRIKTGWASKSMIANAHYWSRHIGSGLAAESFWGSDRLMRVKYEDLVEQPTAILKKICRFLEFNYEDAMSGGGNFTPMFTAIEQHKLVGKPPSSTRIHAWRTELSQRQIEQFELVASGLLFYLGYEPSFGLQSRPRTPVQKFRENARELFIGSFERKINTYLRQKRVAKTNLNAR